MDSENKRCFECRSSEITLVSLYHGIYLCSSCGEYQKLLGNHISCIVPISHSFSQQQQGFLEHGGNKKFSDFLEFYGLTDLSIVKKYYSQAAEYYRQRLKYLSKRTQIDYPPPSSESASKPFMELPMIEEYKEQKTEAQEDQWKLTNTLSYFGGTISSVANSMKSSTESVYNAGAYILGGIKSSGSKIKNRSISALASAFESRPSAVNTKYYDDID